MRQKKKKSPKLLACTLILTGIFCFSVYKLFTDYSSQIESKVKNDKIQETVSIPESTETLPESKYQFPEVDFDALHNINPDVVGWIYIPDTRINYPVLVADNNQFYLKHAVDKSYDEIGSIFIDRRNSGEYTGENTIIYGHHVAEWVLDIYPSMFTDLLKFKDEEFYKSHPYIYYVTPTQKYVLEVFSCAVTNTGTKHYSLRPSELPDADEWISFIKANSINFSDLGFSPEDDYITLSTCDSSVSGNSRAVVHCKMEKIWE